MPLSHNEAAAQWRARNPGAAAAAMHRWRNRERFPLLKQSAAQGRRARAEWAEIRSQFVCEECGESRTPCLDFHHREPALKRFAITKSLERCRAPSMMMDEVEKCAVLCANCHRMLHAAARDR